MEGWILAGVGLAGLLYVLVQYNGFIGLQNQIREAWSNIDTELKRRHDLISNLVRTVQGYAVHEREVLERLVQLRATCVENRGNPAEHAAVESQLSDALRRVLAVVENYPSLKADVGFRELQRELVNTEDRIQAARRFYNGNVRDYRNKRESFPTNVLAKMFGFGDEVFFEINPAIRG